MIPQQIVVFAFCNVLRTCFLALWCGWLFSALKKYFLHLRQLHRLTVQKPVIIFNIDLGKHLLELPQLKFREEAFDNQM